MNWYIIGRVTKPHGVRGAVKILPETDFPQRFKEDGALTLDIRGEKHVYSVEYVKFQGNGMVIVKLQGVDTMDAAEKLRKADVVVDEEHLHPLDEDEYYCHELIGCSVNDVERGELGKVKDIFFNGGTDVYVVESGSGEEILIPAVKEMIKDVDVQKGVITVELFQGLIP